MRRTATGRRCIAACRREGGRRGGSRPGDGDVRYGTVRWVKKSEFFSRLGGRLESVGEEDGRACVRALRCVRGDGSIRSTDERGEREKEKKETLRGRRFARASAALLLCFEETRSMRKRTKKKRTEGYERLSAHLRTWLGSMYARRHGGGCWSSSSSSCWSIDHSYFLTVCPSERWS